MLTMDDAAAIITTTTTTTTSRSATESLNMSPTTTILFPWFVEIVGVIMFFGLTRFELPIPYAAVMFLIGVGLGYGTLHVMERHQGEGEEEELSLSSLDQLTASILQWSNINSGVLLLVFLPGLIFRDAIQVNFTLFAKALPQLLMLAFPMVLVGTVCTAIVAHKALPYGWPLSLAATLGAILSSTDPVAVSSVLQSAGAPPRLQMQIAGESLLNDGSAVVFYSIFSTMYLAEMNSNDDDESVVDWGQGIATFFRMALGGTAVGLAFATGLLVILYELDRRLEPEYNVLQVVAALTVAYLSYYVSEQVCNMSGVIACVVCGITARALGRGMVTNNQLMDSYLALMEYLLNTLLFTLGGVVYGKAIHGGQGNGESTPDTDITWSDFGYLIVFYFLIMAIRMFQVTLFYPWFSRVGLKSNWRETFFLGFGGLRGAVGVALALSLERSARESFSNDDPSLLEWTRKIEFFSGGVTFLTLFVNGTLAGPVLRMLKLAKPKMSRKQTLKLFKSSAENFINAECSKLLTESRFQRANIHTLRQLVPFLTLDLSPPKETVAPVAKRRERRRTKAISDGVAQMAQPNLPLSSTMPVQPSQSLHQRAADDSIMVGNQGSVASLTDTVDYTSTQQEPLNANDTTTQSLVERRRSRRARMKTLSDGVALMANMTASMPSIDEVTSQVTASVIAPEGSECAADDASNPVGDPSLRLAETSRLSCPIETLQEVRGLYLDLLKQAYGEEISNNELDERDDNGFNINLLQQSVAFAAADTDQNQNAIHDWEYTQDFKMLEDVKSFFSRLRLRFANGVTQQSTTYLYQQERASVIRAVLFIEAHNSAEKKLSSFLQNAMQHTNDDGDFVLMTGAMGIVLDESKEQVVQAQKDLENLPASRVDNIITNHVATILLRRLAVFTETRASDGFLTKKEARNYLDRIDQNIQKAHYGRADIDATRTTDAVDEDKDPMESQPPSTASELDF